MDGASDGINLLLPLAFGLVLISLLLFGILIYWFLIRFKVIELPDKYFPFRILKGAFFSFIGVFAFVAIITVITFVLNIIIGFFKK